MGRPDSSLSGASRNLVDSVISKLAAFMEDVDVHLATAFGMRSSHMSRNYPSLGNGGADVRVPLVDQIEFRILPKLRGLEIDGYRAAFDDLNN